MNKIFFHYGEFEGVKIECLNRARCPKCQRDNFVNTPYGKPFTDFIDGWVCSCGFNLEKEVKRKWL